MARQPDLLTVRLESRNGVARVALSGELDMSTVPLLENHLAAVEQDGVDSLMVDLRGLSFIDSSGLHAFIRARRRFHAKGYRLILVGAGPSARRLFEISGTAFLIDDGESVSVLEQFTAQATPGPDGDADPSA